MKWKIHNDDVLKWAVTYDGPLFHAIVCDPPYNLDTIQKRFGKKDAAPAKFGTDGAFQRSSKGFMGQEWDTDVAFQVGTWEAIMRVLYPGALCMAFSSTRTYHRMATAIEEAGFIIHPMIGWIQAQGLPKATNISKLLDKREGVEREIVGTLKTNVGMQKNNYKRKSKQGVVDVTVAPTPLAKIWEEHRYGLQALKPAFEPICVFQKPYDGILLDNIIETGAGSIWIDGNRIGEDMVPSNQFDSGMKPFGHGAGHPYTQATNRGRWPANVILSGDVGLPYEKFFYCAKPKKKERDAGLDEFPDTERFTGGDKMIGISGDRSGAGGKTEPIPVGKSVVKNTHPTVKPVKLTEHLTSLLLPPEEYSPRRLLVPFCGSGSEMIGGALTGWDDITGVEIEVDTCKIAEKRLKYWTND
jgi:site-specific DNA-methyltransferase (adenine-specific)